ncbi:MAG: EamA family transporter [Lachnospiraceae bacterium]|nr:EamA family transporter [Lachnospiraceae bacterium]
MDYLLVFLSVILLSLGFVLQKFYQKKAGPWGAASFSLYTAICSILSLTIINGVQFEFSWYSLINAALRSLCVFLYTLVGFHIMNRGCMALYMLFLMSGGMLLPVLWGWIFLDEPVAPMRVLGVLTIVFAMILTRDKEEKADTIMITCLLAVFFLNGMTSVFAKLHQINEVYETVSTTPYAIYSSLTSLLLSSITKAIRSKKQEKADTTVKHPKNMPGAESLKSSLLLIGIVIIYSVLASISNILQLEGAKTLDASVLYPIITGGTVVFTGIMALIFYGEKPSKREWISIGLCLAGTFMFLE